MSESKIRSNNDGVTWRLTFITQLFRERFSLLPQRIQPIAYEEECPFPYNNFVYHIELNKDASLCLNHQTLPGTQSIPSGTCDFIIRLPNSASGYNDMVRVENEVAALQIARQALEAEKRATLIPRVFDWCSSKNGQQGWILQERMLGKPLVEDFPNMDIERQKYVLEQMAQVLRCFQRYTLPDSIRQYGGLTFDSSGQIVSSAVSIMNGGPFKTYQDLVLATIHSKLAEAYSNSRVNGWRDGGLRDRLHKFLSNGISTKMQAVTKLDKVLVHGDFSTDNILYNPQTNYLTAVLDFDFAHIATVSDEFFRSLGHGIGRFPEARDKENIELHQAMLQGFPDPLPQATENVLWPTAKVWDDVIRSQGLDRPATIPGIVDLSDLFWLSSQLYPWKLTNEVVVRNSSEEQLKKRKEDAASSLDSFLLDHGY